jgi:hypothetical protein
LTEDPQDDLPLRLVAFDHLQVSGSFGRGRLGRPAPELVDDLLAEADVGPCRPQPRRLGELLEVNRGVLDVIGADSAPLESFEAQHVQVLGFPARTGMLAADHAPLAPRRNLDGMLGQPARDRVPAKGRSQVESAAGQAGQERLSGLLC